MKGKRRGRDFIIISFSRSRYIYICFYKGAKVLRNSNNNVELFLLRNIFLFSI